MMNATRLLTFSPVVPVVPASARDSLPRLLRAVLLLLALLLAVAPSSYAATRVVLNNANSGAGSLRDTIAAAVPGDTITFTNTLNGQTIVLTSGELVINKNLSILGPDATNLAISGNGNSRVFFITNGVACTLAGLTIINGRAAGNGFPGGYGGGIHNQGVLGISNITLSGNSARVSGGGIFNGDDGTLTVQASLLSENSATGTGGGIFNAGTLTVQNSLLSTNSTDASGGGLLHKIGTALVQNSTFSGNSAESSGGGIFNNQGKLTVLNSTFSGNSATNGAASLAQNATAALTIGHTLLARGASGTNFTSDSGSVTNLGLNLADDISANAFATPFTNLLLGPLAFNGGPTPTHALLPGSPAIDADATGLPNAWQIRDASGVEGSMIFSNTLSAAQKIAATNSGWHFTVVSRQIEGSGGSGSPAQFMTYGHGNRRFLVGWDIDSDGRLTARCYGAGGTQDGIATNLTAAGEGTNAYHQHELVYSPATQTATYLLDGTPIYTWTGWEFNSHYNGQALFGSAAIWGRGGMNYHHVQFAITGQGTVSEYFAGYQGNPPVAPDPVSQGWTRTWSDPTNTDVTNAPVSPDAVYLTSDPLGAHGLRYDQRGAGYPRRVNGRVDVGAFEVQAPLFFTHITPVPAGIFLRVQGATNEPLQLQWNNTPSHGDWQPLTSGATDATGVLQHTNTGISGQPMRFYRAVRP